jgi:GNAT superfamily N-acetyltransferase
MIEFAGQHTRSLIRSMWKSVFDDTDQYIDLIFSEKYRDENTLLYFDEGNLAACLHMFPYTFRFYEKAIPFYYLAGLSTLPQYRNKGYMGQLISASFRVMQARGIALSILVPAEEWLFGYYEKYGFAQTFEAGGQEVDLGAIIDMHPNDTEKQYRLFDTLYQQRDFITLKTEDEFAAIVTDYQWDGRPPKRNLNGMSRVIQALPLLNLYAEKFPSESFSLRVEGSGPATSEAYAISNGKAIRANIPNADWHIDEKDLAQLLFGCQPENAPRELFRHFDKQQHPILNLMLE